MPPTTTLRRLPDLLRGLAGQVPDVTVSDLTLDSRTAAPGSLFLAVRGTRDHGLRHLAAAVERGAVAVLWEPAPGIDAPPPTLPSVAVEGLSRIVGQVAARFFNDPSARLHCIGVTGTDGKTSTAWLVAQAFDRLHRGCFYVGTLGHGPWHAIEPGDLTTPDPVHVQRLLHRAVSGGNRAAVMEVSSHALDQSRLAGTRLHSSILTNIGRDHLDYHGDVDSYAAAKKRLFLDASPEVAILNRDDPRGLAWAGEFSRLPLLAGRLVTYGLGGRAASARFAIGHELELLPDGVRLNVETHLGTSRIEAGLLGRFNAYNLLATLCALLEAGIGLDEACAALSESRTVPGRIEGFRGTGTPLVVVDYAHTPQALVQVLLAVRAHGARNVTCVFGCGGDRDRGKRPLMAAAVAAHADRAIVTDDNPRSEDPAAIVREIHAGFPAGFSASVVHDRREAIDAAIRTSGPDDVVVVAGKGHETTQTYGRAARPFSDRVVVAELLGAPPPTSRLSH